MARIPRKVHSRNSVTVTHMWEHHKEIARRILLGERQMDICRSINVSPAWLSIVCASPAFVRYLDGLRARTELGIIDVRKEITAGAIKGIKVLQELLGSTNEQVKLKAAIDLLDRDGHGAVRRVEQTNVEVHLTADRLMELKERRQRMLEQSKMVCINQ